VHFCHGTKQKEFSFCFWPHFVLARENESPDGAFCALFTTAPMHISLDWNKRGGGLCAARANNATLDSKIAFPACHVAAAKPYLPRRAFCPHYD
jgi:hypothetical protein